MEKKIILNNVSVLANVPGFKKKRKVLKNINLNLENNSVVSIVANDDYDRKLIGEVIAGRVKPTHGDIRFIGNYLNDRTLYRGQKVDFITLESLEDVRNDTTINSYLKENILKKKFIEDNYRDSLEEYKQELIEIQKERDIISDNKKLAKLIANKKINNIIDYSLTKMDKFKDEYLAIKTIKQYNDYIFDNNESIKNEWKSLDENIISAKELFLGKEESIIIQYKNIVKEIKELKRLERQEMKVRNTSDETDRDIEDLVFSRSKRELNNIIKYIKSLSTPNVNLGKSFMNLLSKTADLQNRGKYYKDIDDCMKAVKKLTTFTNEEISSHLTQRLEFLKNILDPKTHINSREFNRLLTLLDERYQQRKKYFLKVIDDINLEIESTSKKDKQERINSMRQVWEHEIVSLRFQAQIYRERIMVIDDFKKLVDEAALRHAEDNTNEIYLSVLKMEATLNKIDLALNKWRFRRKVSLLKLISKIKNEELNHDNDLLNKKIVEKNSERKLKGLFYDYHNSYIATFTNERKSRIKDYELTDLERNYYDEKLDSINNRINELNIIIEDLENKVSIKSFENEELLLTYLLDDISLDTDSLNTIFKEISLAQKQRVSLIKSILEGKEIIIIEDPKYDLDINAKSEIVQSIKNIVARQNVMIILLTDDVKLAAAVSDRIAFMHFGTVFEKGKLNKVIDNPIHPYSKWMIQQGLYQKYGNMLPFEGKELNHNIFSAIENMTISDDHTVFCTKEEIEKWT